VARIAGVDIPNNKRIGTSLTYIFGIGDFRAEEICVKAKIDPEVKTRDLTEEQRPHEQGPQESPRRQEEVGRPGLPGIFQEV
jgi:predicted ribosome quality control (RQC) complex YloA/Tae2 family protein